MIAFDEGADFPMEAWGNIPSRKVAGPCAKTVVTCTIVSLEGDEFVGTNACNNAQPDCPRDPGEGYEKCETICEQQGHAEIQALREAGDKAEGAYALLEGHTYACDDCKAALKAAGVTDVWVLS